MADQPLTRKKRRRVFLSNRKTVTNRKKFEIIKNIQLPTSNRFAALQHGMEMDEQQAASATTKKPTFSPIVVTDHTSDIQAILKELKLENCNLKINSVGRKIFPNSAEEKEIIAKKLKEKNIFYFTHPDQSAKVYKVILSGLPQINTDEIKASLTAQNVTPTKISMFNTNSPNKLYLIHFNADEVNKKTLEGIKYVYHHVIRWETYKPKRNGSTICMRCCMYGHGQASCSRYIVCMLCAGEHLTAQCTVHNKNSNNNNNISYTCFNCKSANLPHAHKANDVNCPFREKYERARNNARTKTPTNQRSQTNVARFVQAPPPTPLRSSFADSMRASTSSASHTQRNTASSTNIQSQARTNSNTRFNNMPSHSNNNDNNINVNNNIWSFDECANILFDSIERLQQCKSKFDQLKVITDLLRHACK